MEVLWAAIVTAIATILVQRVMQKGGERIERLKIDAQLAQQGSQAAEALKARENQALADQRKQLFDEHVRVNAILRAENERVNKLASDSENEACRLRLERDVAREELSALKTVFQSQISTAQAQAAKATADLEAMTGMLNATRAEVLGLAAECEREKAAYKTELERLYLELGVLRRKRD